MDTSTFFSRTVPCVTAASPRISPTALAQWDQGGGPVVGGIHDVAWSPGDRQKHRLPLGIGLLVRGNLDAVVIEQGQPKAQDSRVNLMGARDFSPTPTCCMVFRVLLLVLPAACPFQRVRHECNHLQRSGHNSEGHQGSPGHSPRRPGRVRRVCRAGCSAQAGTATDCLRGWPGPLRQVGLGTGVHQFPRGPQVCRRQSHGEQA